MQKFGRRTILNKTIIDKVLKQGDFDYSFLTIPSISEKRNIIYCFNVEMQQKLKSILWVEFDKNNIAITKKLILRKELRKLL